MLFNDSYKAYIFACEEIEAGNVKELYVTKSLDGNYHVRDCGFLPEGREEFKLKLKKCPTKHCKNKVAATNITTYLDLSKTFHGRFCGSCRDKFRDGS